MGVQNTLAFEFMIGPKVEDQSLELARVFSQVGTNKIWLEIDVTVAPLYYLGPIP